MERIITKTTFANPQLPKKTRVAAYVRVSSGKDEMLHSLAAQVGFYSNYIQNHKGWEYAGVYADEALTGTKDSRPEFQRLISDCRKGKIDLVITKSISRFTRNTVTLLETVRELKLLGVDVFFEEQNIHTQSSDGELMLTILASYAQEESRSASENQKWRIRKSYKEGKPSNHFCVYGYHHENGRFIIIPEEADVVRMIYSDYLSGLGRNAIARKLSSLGIPTKRGGNWSAKGIERILKNEKYIGDVLLQKSFVTDHLTKKRKDNNGELPQYYVEDSHEAIISLETFTAVQEEIARRAEASGQKCKQTVSEFSGRIRCQRCGANFMRKINHINTKYEKTVWACTTFTERGKAFCGAKRIPEDILKEKCVEVMGLTEYAPDVFKKRISHIDIPDDGVLTFVFQDGSQSTLTWKHRSRSESWTDEMKATAREKAKRRRS